MKAKTKKLWLLTAVLFAFVSFTAMYTASQLASAYTVPELSIVNGASVRVVDTSDNETAKESNGLRFATYMDKVEYETLMKQTDVTDVKFGVLIAPDTATYVLNKDTVFSTDPTVKKYDWAVFNTTTGNWDYSGDGTYTRIMNFTSDVLYENTAIGTEDNVYFTGSIVGIKPENLANEWQGIGYMSYVENGAVKYQFTDKVVRSMAYTAQLAIDDTSEKAPDADQKAWLQKYYVNEVTDVATTYSTEYYVEQKDGTFALKETVSTDATIDDVATPGEAKEIAGYVYDAENLNNALDGNKVLANGKLVYKRYYLMTEVGLVDKSSETDKNSVRTLDGYTATVNKVIGRTATPVENATFVDGVLDVSSLDGTYNLVLTKGEKTLTRTFDVYDSTQAPEWLNTLSMDNFWAYRTNTGNSQTVTTRNSIAKMVSVAELNEVGHKGNYYFVDGLSENAWCGAPFAFNVIAKHSKAYYEKYADYNLTFEYYRGNITGKTGASIYQYYALPLAGAIETSATAGRYMYYGWYNATVSISDLLEKWDIINDLTTEAVTGYGYSLLGNNYEPAEYTYMGNFKIAKTETLPDTPAETPVWNIVSESVREDYTHLLRNNSFSDGYYPLTIKDRVSIAGNYYQSTAITSLNSADYMFVLKPYYEKSVYQAYLDANPNAVFTYNFVLELKGDTNNVRRGYFRGVNGDNGTTVYLESGEIYTITIPLSHLVKYYDNMSGDMINSYYNYLFAVESLNKQYNANGTIDTTLSAGAATDFTFYAGNFQINATGTVGVVKQA